MAGRLLHEELTERIIGHELKLAGLSFQRQVAIPVNYKGIGLDCSYRIDILVEGTVIVEIKAVEHVLGGHEAQLLTYMKLTRTPVGLLINFNVPVLAQGVVRKVLREVLRASASPL
jgi:GxxExxY protein